MNHHFALRLNATDGALPRVLGVVQRRGFRLLGCTAVDDEDGYHVQLHLSGARDPRLLCRQLDRLLDVRSAALEEETRGLNDLINDHLNYI